MKNKEEFYKVSDRVYFSKYFKRRVLIEFAKLKNPNKAFIACGFNLDEYIKNDKKYASKLLHKWRKELYANPNMLNILNFDLTDNVLKNEIAYLDDEAKKDKIIKKLLPKIKLYKKYNENKIKFAQDILNDDSYLV